MKYIFKISKRFRRNRTGLVLRSLGVKGVSLIEVVVALAIFNIIMVVAIDSYLNVIKINRQTVYEQSLQEHTRFLYELMTKEIKTAKISDGSCPLLPRDNMYKATDPDADGNDDLYLQNYRGDCVHYFMDTATKKLKVQRTGSSEAVIMPNDILLEKLQFDVTDLRSSGAKNKAPLVTIYIQLKNKNQVSGWTNAVLEMQSSISGRYLE